jgi:hypothetical protein
MTDATGANGPQVDEFSITDHGDRLECQHSAHLGVTFGVQVLEVKPDGVRVLASVTTSAALLYSGRLNLDDQKQRRAFLREVEARGVALKNDGILLAFALRARTIHAEAAEPTDAPSGGRGLPYDYLLREDGGPAILRLTLQGTERLTNFLTRITRHVKEDLGLGEEVDVYELEVDVAGEPAPRTITVPRSKFYNSRWLEEFSTAADWSAGSGAREHVRRAVVNYSRHPVPVAHHLKFTGWRGRQFLHAGGAIGADGACEGVTTVLRDGLEHFQLKLAADPDERQTASRATLALLDVAPREITWPLFAAVFLPPLAPLLTPHEPDFTMFVAGDTGILKTSVAVVLQQHYGADFAGPRLPGSFEDTAHSIEFKLCMAKDVLAVVDDLCPTNNPRRAQQMAEVAEVIFRGGGNRVGRARMRRSSDGIKAGYAPRGFVLVTGEQLPTMARSNRARLFVVSIHRDAINKAKLTAAQECARLYPITTGEYVRWLAEHYDELATRLPLRYRALRAEASQAGHARAPGQISHLTLAIEIALEFLVFAGAITTVERHSLREGAWNTFKSIAEAEGEEAEREAPAVIFAHALLSLLASRQVCLESADNPGQPPSEPERFGWILRAPDPGPYPQWVSAPRAVLLGYVKDDGKRRQLYLNPEATYAAVYQSEREGGRIFPVNAATLWWRLVEAGVAIPGTNKSKPKALKTVRVRDATSKALVVDFDKLVGLAASGAGDEVDAPVSPDGVNGNGAAPHTAGGDADDERHVWTP